MWSSFLSRKKGIVSIHGSNDNRSGWIKKNEAAKWKSIAPRNFRILVDKKVWILLRSWETGCKISPLSIVFRYLNDRQGIWSHVRDYNVTDIGPSAINFLMCDQLLDLSVNIQNLEFFWNFKNFSLINYGIRNLKIWNLKTIELKI